MVFQFLLICLTATLFAPITSAALLCNQDNCLREFQNNKASASAVCADWFASPPTPTYPAFASACSSSAAKFTSACNCIASSSGTTASTTCPTIPPSTVTVTSVTTVSVTQTTCSSSSSTPPPVCSCNNMLGNPSFENSTASPWRIIQDDPNGHWSIAPSQDIPGGAFDGYASIFQPLTTHFINTTEEQPSPKIPSLQFQPLMCKTILIFNLVNEWALEYSWSNNPSQDVGIYQSVPIPSCCFGPQLELSWAVLSPANTCIIRLYWNVIFPAFPSGQLASVPWVTYTVLPGGGWQPDSLTWSFGSSQPDFQMEILVSCQNTSPVWIDLVTVNPA
jgi:hypothetical protein